MAASGIVDAQTWVEEPRGPRRLPRPCCTCNGWSAASRRTGCPRSSPSPSPPPRRSPRPWASRSAGPSSCWSRRSPKRAEDARGRGEPDPLPADRGQVYEAAVTVMMRVVFLLFAEERGLLPQGQLFTMGYGISGELDALDRRAREERSEALDATYLTWHRLLATSQALYARSVVRGHPAARPTAARCSTPADSRS